MEELFELEEFISTPVPPPSSNIGQSWENIHENMNRALRGSFAKLQDTHINHKDYGKQNLFKKSTMELVSVNNPIRLRQQTENYLKQHQQKKYLRIDTESRSKLKSQMRSLASNQLIKQDSGQPGFQIKKTPRPLDMKEASCNIPKRASLYIKAHQITGSCKKITQPTYYTTQIIQQSNAPTSSKKQSDTQVLPNICDTSNKGQKSKTQSVGVRLAEEPLIKQIPPQFQKNASKVNIMLGKSHSVYQLKNYGHLISVNEKCRPIHSVFLDPKKQYGGLINSRNAFSRGRGKLKSLHTSASKQNDNRISFSKDVHKQKILERSKPVPANQKLKLNRKENKNKEKISSVQYPLVKDGINRLNEQQ